jgi:polysaccharide biosynthesis transport protein
MPAAAEDLGAQLAALQTLRSGRDPTLHVETVAAAPTSPASPKVGLAIAAGLISGLLLGAAGALAIGPSGSRRRAESRVPPTPDLPILARLPRQGGGVLGVLENGEGAPGDGQEAYRALGTRLLPGPAANGDGGGRVILVTGAAGSEGTSTTALNLARSFAEAGQRAILIDVHLGSPALWRLAGQPPQTGLLAALRGQDLGGCLVGLRSPAIPDSLRFLLPEDAHSEDGDAAHRILGGSAAELLARARELADVVVIDSPPLATTPAALALAGYADEILVVARAGHTRPDELEALGDVVSGRGLSVAGMALVGATSSPEGGRNGGQATARG